MKPNALSSNPSLASRTFWSAGGSLVATAGRMIAAIFVARELGPQLAGLYAFYTWLIEFMLVVFTVGLPITLTKFFAESSEISSRYSTEEISRWILRRYTLLIITGGIVFFYLRSYFVENNDDEILSYIIILMIFMQGISIIVSSYLSGKQDFKKLALLNFTTTVVLVLIQPILTSLFDLKGAILGVTISCAVALFWTKPIFVIAIDRGVSAAPPNLIRYSVYAWLAAVVSSVVWTRAELFFLQQYSSPVQVGYYSAGLLLTSFVIIAAGMLTGALLPHFSGLIANNDYTKLQVDYARFTVIVALFSFPLSLGAAVSMPELVLLFFGPAYTSAAPSAAILMMTGMFVFAGAGSSMLHAFGKSDIIFKVGLIGAALITLGCLFVTTRYGATGTAWVRLSVQLFMIASGITYIHKKLNMILPYGALFRLAVVSLLAALAAKIALLMAPIYPLAFAFLSGSLTYLALVRYAQPLSGSDISALLDAMPRMPKLLRQITPQLIRWTLLKP